MGSCINGEEKNLLEKFRGEPKMEHEIGGLLDLRLSSMDMYIDQSKKELDLTGHLRGGPEKPKVMEAPNNRLAKKLEERKYFPCKYCKKKFSNSQALGGHQNAHRRERAWMRKDRRLDMPPYGHMDGYSYLLQAMAPSSSHYNHGRSLGVNMQYSSMIHKQPPHGSFHRLGSTIGGLEGWPRPSAFMNQNVFHDNYWTSIGAFPTQDSMGLINRRASFDTFSGSGFLTNQNNVATRIYSDDHVNLAGDDLSLNL